MRATAASGKLAAFAWGIAEVMTDWTRPIAGRRPTLFGPLERRVLLELWSRGAPTSVRDLRPAFPAMAYTTLMTTLDRLHRKGLLARERTGRAYVYRPHQTRQEFESARVTDALRAAIAHDASALGPVMSLLVDAIGDYDEDALDELEALVRARRAGISEKKP